VKKFPAKFFIQNKILIETLALYLKNKSVISLLKKQLYMPQKSHDKAAQHNEEAAKHHKSASKHASEGNHEKAAQHAQAAQGHQQKANEHSGKAAAKYAEKAGTMKKEDMENDEAQETESGRKSSKK
jgi:hypothetical protein